MKIEGMKPNPCLDCNSPLKEDRCKDFYECGDKRLYEGSIVGAKAVLKKLLRMRPMTGRGSVYQYNQLLEQMLKELEEMK